MWKDMVYIELFLWDFFRKVHNKMWYNNTYTTVLNVRYLQKKYIVYDIWMDDKIYVIQFFFFILMHHKLKSSLTREYPTG
jgi:hypothetical protein